MSIDECFEKYRDLIMETRRKLERQCLLRSSNEAWRLSRLFCFQRDKFDERILPILQEATSDYQAEHEWKYYRIEYPEGFYFLGWSYGSAGTLGEEPEKMIDEAIDTVKRMLGERPDSPETF